ncbi:uncharacterized protein [Temnothorax nylanderi]|uniref:uncharacterized protein n=1 Tax=Temnothorax nylanderi TaxID=102681 RepID=UPI003A8981CF
MAEGIPEGELTDNFTSPENINEETLVYTCGMCETILHKNEIDPHLCFEGFNEFYIDENLYIYPQSDDGQIIRKSLVDGTEAMVLEPREETTQIQNREADGNWQNQKVLQEEQLIEEVRKRPALYDCRRPLAERGLRARNKLWEEIVAAMNSTMDVATIKKKWKSLCDANRIHRNKQHQPSGSAGTRRSSWVHAERMQFINDMQLQTETATNIPASEGHEELSNDSDIFRDGSIGSNSSSRGSRKRRLSIDEDRPFDRLVDALGQPPTINIPPFTPPPPPPTQPTDKAALFGSLVAAQLREIDPRRVDDIMLQVMQILSKAKKL